MHFKNKQVIETPAFVPAFKYSPYQQNLFDWGIAHAHKKDAAVVNAVAGSGKSTSLRELTRIVANDYENILSLAFNAHIAKDGREKNKLPNVKIITYHALGLSGIKKVYKPEIDTEGKKVESLVKSRMGSNKYFLIPSIKRLTDLCKGCYIPQPSHSDLYEIALTYDIELYEDQSDNLKFEIFDATQKAIIDSIDTASSIIDFSDMIFIPLVNDLSLDQFDMILADEFQDTNIAQAMLIQKARTGVMIGIGDSKQSIYAFRGADSTAMDKLVEEFGAEQLPLSISYRCPKVVGDLIRREFPEIKFETPDWAKDGNITEVGIEKSLDLMQEGDMVLSRINANLPSIAFALIRKGKTARIMGRDIGKSLEALIKKQKVDSLPELFTKLEDYREKQYQKFLRLNRPDKIRQIDDQIETVSALSDGANSVWDVITRCQTMFSDERGGVSLGTIHKNKGAEANNVFITRPDLMPLPFVMQKGSAEDKQQELNMRYVGLSRSSENLVFCHGDL